MRRAPRPLLLAGIAGLFLLPGGAAAGPAAPDRPGKGTESSEGQWVFSLLPKSFQDNPFVDQTVITEMTEAGRKIPPPSREKPSYYFAQPSGYHGEGHGTETNHPPPEELLARSLRQALAVNGYLPAPPGQPPALLILYVWGVHNNLDTNLDPSRQDVGGTFLDVGHRNLISRAALVGGTRFAGELKAALEQHDRMKETPTTPLLDPLRLFTERDPKSRQLVEQSKADCYYVVASAYDYQAGVHGARKLLWRSKMTVDARGVSMTDTLPTLILGAGKYLGRDMPEAATMTRRMQRTGQATLGPLEVKEYLEKLPPPAGQTPEPVPAPAQQR